MSDEKPWIDEYEPHEWTVYQLTSDDEKPELTDAMSEFVLYAAESEGAARAHRRSVEDGIEYPNFFFWDFEQLIAADRDRVYGLSRLGRLTTEWNGHPPNSLVMVTYEGIEDEPRKTTYLVAA